MICVMEENLTMTSPLKVLTVFLLLCLFTLAVSQANAQTVYQKQEEACSLMIEKMENNLKKVFDIDRIKDNKHMIKANLWANSYTMHGCSPEPYVNVLRRYVN
ncbi:MAG: hypothetical protein VXY83_02135 [Pseudomonadota bacterium]|nr:hypothetical protein [Pseudomonadota bacterium]